VFSEPLPGTNSVGYEEEEDLCVDRQVCHVGAHESPLTFESARVRPNLASIPINQCTSSPGHRVPEATSFPDRVFMSMTKSGLACVYCYIVWYYLLVR